jgi:hypothetical protein
MSKKRLAQPCVTHSVHQKPASPQESKAAEIARLLRNREQDLREVQNALLARRKLEMLNSELLHSRCQEHKLKMENQNLRHQLSIMTDSFKRDTYLRSPQFINGSSIFENQRPGNDTAHSLSSQNRILSADWHVTQVVQTDSKRIQEDHNSSQYPSHLHRTLPTEVNTKSVDLAGSQPLPDQISPFSPLYGLRNENRKAVISPKSHTLLPGPKLSVVLTEAEWHINCVRAMLQDGFDTLFEGVDAVPA